MTHVVVVHCETTSGVLNPVEEIAAVTARHDRRLLIDAMSAFGAIPLDARRVPFDALVASANKCLEGVPGVGFAIVRREALEEARGQAPSLSLDLHDQWVGDGEERAVALHPAHPRPRGARPRAGPARGRGRRGRAGRPLSPQLHACWWRACARMGFETLLPDRLQAPIIVTVRMPADPKFHFETFYDRLAQRGYVIYPGKLTVADSFRIGCIGALGEPEMRGALAGHPRGRRRARRGFLRSGRRVRRSRGRAGVGRGAAEGEPV